MNPSEKPLRVLFLCTGNSARSIFAEYLLRRIGQRRFEAFSAGAHPQPAPNPFTLKVLSDIYKIDASDARSKSWEEFKNETFDFVITVCDDARETCPVFPGQPLTAHWSSPDPVPFEGTDMEKLNYFRQVALQIHRRVDLFCSLGLEKLDKLRLQQAMSDIGRKD